MTLDQFCSSDQWSMLTSASEHSKLAAALGGFLITAIALYFKGETCESVHTMALFSSAVLILVLDSFLFSMLTGTVVPGDAGRQGICALAWTQGALATAMLAAGATARSAVWAGCWPAMPSTGCPAPTPPMSGHTRSWRTSAAG